MGVIARQTLKSSTVGYLAAVIGVLNTFFIYTLCFDEAELGRFRYVQEMGIILASFFSLGITNVVVRFFPEFRDDTNKHNGLLSFVIVVLLAGIGIFSLLYAITRDYWPVEFQDNIGWIFFLFVAIMFANSFFYYSSNFRLITIPNVFRQLGVKIGLGLSALAFLYRGISFEETLNYVVLVYAAATVSMFGYLIYKGNFAFGLNLKFFTNKRLKNIAVFAGFGILSSLGSSLASKLDVFMVTDMLSFSKTGVYSIAMSITGLMILVTGPMISISGPILAESLAKNDLPHVEEVYKKSSVTLFLFGSLLLLLLWVNIDSIFALIPNGERYTSGKIVILILGIAKLADMLTSVNEVIISYSKYFRFNLYALLLLGILNVGANLLFIPMFDIAGAALATCMSVVLYNGAKTLFIYHKFSIHPFQSSLLYIAILAVVCYFGVNAIGSVSQPLLSIAMKSTIVLIVFGYVTLKFNFSDDITHLWNQVKSKASAIFNK